MSRVQTSSILQKLRGCKNVATRTSLSPVSSSFTEVPVDVQLDVLRSATEAAVTLRTSDNLLDSLRSTAAQNDCRLVVTNGHFRWFGAASFMHQLVIARLTVQLARCTYTVCPDASVQYRHDNFRSHDISVWEEDAEIIKKNMISGSDTRIDGVKLPPYTVVEVISPRSRQKDEREVKRLCAVNGVRYFWLTHPKDAWVEIHELSRDATSKLIGTYYNSNCTQKLLPFDLEIDLQQIFK